MPLPTAAEMRDRTKTNAQMREMMAQMADNVVSKETVDKKLSFVESLPEDNQFIRELYITGWNGSDELYLMGFNANDNGKVTFQIKNKTANRLVVYTYQQTPGLPVYLLMTSGDAVGSGFAGYIAIDWTKYSAAVSPQGVYKYKINSRAKSLTACPFISSYINGLANTQSIEDNKIAINTLNTITGELLKSSNFIEGLPGTNKFIRELYITGWNGTDEIFLQYFTNNDGGLVTFAFRDKTNSRDVIYTYKKALGLSIYPLETSGAAAGSGFGGYVVVDWNYYTAPVSSGGNYLYKVSQKARSLTNCPYIKEYLDNIDVNAKITINTSDITAIKADKIKYNTILEPTATHAQFNLITNLIPSLKLLSGHVTGCKYYLSSIQKSGSDLVILLKVVKLDNTEAWAGYNLTFKKGANNIETHIINYDTFRWQFVIDWRLFSSITSNISGALATTLLNLDFLMLKDVQYLLANQANFYKVGNAIKDGQSKNASFLANAAVTVGGDTAYSYSVTQVPDGTRIVLTNNNANVNRSFRFRFNPFYIRTIDTYFAYTKFTVNSFSGTQNFFGVSISKSGVILDSGGFFDNIVAGKTYEEVRKIPGKTNGGIALDGSLDITFFSSNNSAAGVVLDITIHDMRLLYNYEQDPLFVNKERKEIEQLVRALGYFEEEVIIPKFVDTSLFTQNINTKLEMQAIGDSTSVMVMWQERLAQLKGWHFNRDMAINGINGGYPMAIGGSWCEPIISNFGGTGQAGKNHYTRSSSIQNYGIDVLFVLSSYNGQHFGQAWQSGGKLVPLDHGINDAPYFGGEVDLISNPTADFPSFGASYYGMLENIMRANPNTRIVLLTLYLFDATTENAENIKLKNAVIRKAAEKYNLQLIDLERNSGINKITAHMLCFGGGVHVNQAGGNRLAQVIGGLV